MNRQLATTMIALWYVLAAPDPAVAGEVRGTLKLPDASAARRTLGYTRTLTTAPAESTKNRRTQVALFLSVKESLPIRQSQTLAMRLSGLRFLPAVAACAVDGKVKLSNEDNLPVTVKVGDKVVARLDSGETTDYECVAGGPKENFRALRVVEWPHIRGTVFVGEVGVAALPKPDGSFSLKAPKGLYELRVVGEHGLLLQKDVKVDSGGVDIGTLVVAEARAKATPDSPAE